MSNPNLQQDIQALLSRAKQELEFITASERLALDSDMKVSIAIFSYLLCTVLDQLWRAISLKYGVIFKKPEYYPCIIDNSKDIDAVLLRNSIPSEGDASSVIKDSQPFLKTTEEDKWLKHLKYFRNFNSHSALSTGEQYAEFDLIRGAAKTILNISYKELDGSVIEIKNAHAFLHRCFEEVSTIADLMMKEIES